MRSVTFTAVSIFLFAFATHTVLSLPVSSRHIAKDNVDATNAAAIDGVSFIYKRQVDGVLSISHAPDGGYIFGVKSTVKDDPEAAARYTAGNSYSESNDFNDFNGF